MEIRNLCCSSSSTEIIQLGRSTNHDRPSLKVTRTTNNRASTSKWRSLWKKLMREKSRKMRIFDCSAAPPSQVHLPGYDPDTYAQNFDHGLMWDDEPDALSRSFSMRFAAPSRLSNSSNNKDNNNNNNNAIIRRVSDVSHDHNLVICVFQLTEKTT